MWNLEAQFGCIFLNRAVRVDGKGSRISSGRMWPLYPGCGWVLEKGVQVDGLTAIWGLQALMGREARDFPGRGWSGMPSPTFSLPLPPQGCTYSIPSSDPQVSSTATSSSAHCLIGPPSGSEPTILHHRLVWGLLHTRFIFCFHLYSKTFFSNVSFD